MRRLKWLALVPLVWLSACLEMDETVSLYLLPSGKIELIAYLDNIHSGETTEPARKKDHAEFLRDWKSGAFGVKALKAGGVKAVKQDLLRDSPPFAAVLRGTHDKLETFWELFDFNTREGGKRATVKTEKGTTTLSFHRPEPDSRDFPKRLNLILTQGEFTEAKGFTVSADRKTCTLTDSRAADLSCSWKF